MGTRYRFRRRAVALTVVATSLLGAGACGAGNGEDGEDGGQMQEEDGNEEED